MNLETIDQRIQAYQHRLRELLTSEPLSVSTLLSRREAHMAPAVYTLYTPDDELIVYAGRTKTKSIAGRIADHRNAGTASDLSGMLKRRPDLPQAVNDYLVRYVAVEDERDRLFFEYFVIGCLAPPLNR